MSIDPTTDQTWIESGSAFCDVESCNQLADIIADSWNGERFCADHTGHAAAIPGLERTFRGWYRITGVRDHQLGLTLTVHPI